MKKLIVIFLLFGLLLVGAIPVLRHNTIDGLQGGTTDEYYHLTDSQHNIITDWGSTAPSSPSETGTTGTITYDSSYLYIAVSTDTWKRAALSTWAVAAVDVLLLETGDVLLLEIADALLLE